MWNTLQSFGAHPQLIAQQAQFWIPFLVVGASLLGSLHCVGMCGGIVMALPPQKKHHAFYHLGRLTGYLLIGTLAGLAGSWLMAYQQLLSGVSALLVSASFLALAWMFWQGRPLHIPLPPWFKRPLERAIGHQLSQSQKTLASGLLGFLTVFMPCGWLYSFVLGALLTGNIWLGGAFLFSFWLGTLPALWWGPGFLSRWLRQHQGLTRKGVALTFVCLALLNVGLKLNSKASITAEHLHDLTQEIQCH